MTVGEGKLELRALLSVLIQGMVLPNNSNANPAWRICFEIVFNPVVVKTVAGKHR